MGKLALSGSRRQRAPASAPWQAWLCLCLLVCSLPGVQALQRRIINRAILRHQVEGSQPRATITSEDVSEGSRSLSIPGRSEDAFEQQSAAARFRTNMASLSLTGSESEAEVRAGLVSLAVIGLASMALNAANLALSQSRATSLAISMAARQASSRNLNDIVQRNVKIQDLYTNTVGALSDEANKRLREIVVDISLTVLDPRNDPAGKDAVIKASALIAMGCRLINGKAPESMDASLKAISDSLKGKCADGKLTDATFQDANVAKTIQKTLYNALLQDEVKNFPELEELGKATSIVARSLSQSQQPVKGRDALLALSTDIGSLAGLLSAPTASAVSQDEPSARYPSDSLIPPGATAGGRRLSAPVVDTDSSRKGRLEELEDMEAISREKLASIVRTGSLSTPKQQQPLQPVEKKVELKGTTDTKVSAGHVDEYAIQKSANRDAPITIVSFGADVAFLKPDAESYAAAAKSNFQDPGLFAYTSVAVAVASIGLTVFSMWEDRNREALAEFKDARDSGILNEMRQTYRPISSVNMCRLGAQLKKTIHLTLQQAAFLVGKDGTGTIASPIASGVMDMLGLGGLEIKPDLQQKLAKTFLIRLFAALGNVFERASGLFEPGKGYCVASNDMKPLVDNDAKLWADLQKALPASATPAKTTTAPAPATPATPAKPGPAQPVPASTTSSSSEAPMQVSSKVFKTITGIPELKKKLDAAVTAKTDTTEAARLYSTALEIAAGGALSRSTCVPYNGSINKDDIFDVVMTTTEWVGFWTSIGYSVLTMPAEYATQARVAKGQDFGLLDGDLSVEFSGAGRLGGLMGGAGVKTTGPSEAIYTRIIVVLKCKNLPAENDPDHKKATHIPEAVVKARTASPGVIWHIASLQQPVSDFMFVKRAAEDMPTAEWAKKHAASIAKLQQGGTAKGVLPSESELGMLASGFEPVPFIYNPAKVLGELAKAPAQVGDPILKGGNPQAVNTKRNMDTGAPPIFAYVLKGGASAIQDLQLLPFHRPPPTGSVSWPNLADTSIVKAARNWTEVLKKARLDWYAEQRKLQIAAVLKKDGPKFTFTDFDDQKAMNAVPDYIPHRSLADDAFLFTPKGCVLYDSAQPPQQLSREHDQKDNPKETPADVISSRVLHNFEIQCPQLPPQLKWTRLSGPSPFEDLWATNSQPAHTLMPNVWALRRLVTVGLDDLSELKLPPSPNAAELAVKGFIIGDRRWGQPSK